LNTEISRIRQFCPAKPLLEVGSERKGGDEEILRRQKAIDSIGRVPDPRETSWQGTRLGKWDVEVDERGSTSGIWGVIWRGSPKTIVAGWGSMSGKSSSEKRLMISPKTDGSRKVFVDRSIFLLSFITLIIQNEPITGRLSEERIAAVSADRRRPIIPQVLNYRWSGSGVVLDPQSSMDFSGHGGEKTPVILFQLPQRSSAKSRR
jgi:hypothetical protein